ncbi:hypothetical protein BN8_05912 [Fibrisoma limi BUZ 3]|uniref:Carboxypeptidase regulatory-like domain-containing protein n=1 Tax=Fibrisoma limi BUZ 3 TaxID=1185876 RepID=I2GRM9_9BACT|nr:carboxypeptidase-like regulatory domain-containing protein [Fibrisoma limi]CCH56557.1 hypothetical protein BN8_05912 [Fibrisoma limi BUZ 3]
MANITGTVVDANDIPLPNVSLLLVGGGGAPQVTLSGINGSYSFVGPAVGNYKVSAIRGRNVIEQLAQIASGQTTDTVVDFKMITTPTRLRLIDLFNRFVLLKYGQYLFLAVIGWIFFYCLIVGSLPELSLAKLNNIETARGAITYLVAVTTISMAAILMLAAIMTGGKDLDKRFTLGKEILTLLIGILGTIIGFYYGSSDKSQASGTTDSLRVDTVAFSATGRQVLVSGQVSGGSRPYVYAITATPKGIVTSITDKFSANGRVRDTLSVLDTTKGRSVTFVLKGRDGNNASFTWQSKPFVVNQ